MTRTRSTVTGTPHRRPRLSTNAASESASARRAWLTCRTWRVRPRRGRRARSAWRSATESAPPDTPTKTVSPPASIPWRRIVRRTFSTNSVPVVTFGLEPDPHLPVLEVFLLPDGDGLLQAVDGEAAGLEGLGPVGRRHGDDDAGLPDLEPPDPVRPRDRFHARPAGVDHLADLPHLGFGRRRGGLFRRREERDRRPSGEVPRVRGPRAHGGSQDAGDRPDGPRPLAGRESGRDGSPGGTARDWGGQRHHRRVGGPPGRGLRGLPLRHRPPEGDRPRLEEGVLRGRGGVGRAPVRM